MSKRKKLLRKLKARLKKLQKINFSETEYSPIDNLTQKDREGVGVTTVFHDLFLITVIEKKDPDIFQAIRSKYIRQFVSVDDVNFDAVIDPFLKESAKFGITEVDVPQLKESMESYLHGKNEIILFTGKIDTKKFMDFKGKKIGESIRLLRDLYPQLYKITDKTSMSIIPVEGDDAEEITGEIDYEKNIHGIGIKLQSQGQEIKKHYLAQAYHHVAEQAEEVVQYFLLELTTTLEKTLIEIEQTPEILKRLLSTTTLFDKYGHLWEEDDNHIILPFDQEDGCSPDK